jgi:hypothetical protein
MRRLLSAALILASGLSFLTVGEARAQGPGVAGSPTYTRPTVSPWLNLGRGGAPALNYYQGVRPETDLYRNISQTNRLNQQVSTNQQGIQDIASGLLTTGHSVRFMSYGYYFQNLSGQGGQQRQQQQQQQRRAGMGGGGGGGGGSRGSSSGGRYGGGATRR